MGLSKETCVPCQGGIPPMSKENCEAKLQEIDNWNLADNAKFLSKNFEFKNFKESLVFVNKVGEIAEEQGHHPDITFGWGYVGLVIQTHKINGLHENDFILAAKTDEIS